MCVGVHVCRCACAYVCVCMCVQVCASRGGGGVFLRPGAVCGPGALTATAPCPPQPASFPQRAFFPACPRRPSHACPPPPSFLPLPPRLLQDLVLFNDSIYYNINYGRLGGGKQEVEEAAKQVGRAVCGSGGGGNGGGGGGGSGGVSSWRAGGVTAGLWHISRLRISNPRTTVPSRCVFSRSSASPSLQPVSHPCPSRAPLPRPPSTTRYCSSQMATRRWWESGA